MKGNVIDIKTKKKVFVDAPRNTTPGGIFISFEDLLFSLRGESFGHRKALADSLEEYSHVLKIPKNDMGMLLFMFDKKNSKKFLVEHIISKADSFVFGCNLTFE